MKKRLFLALIPLAAITTIAAGCNDGPAPTATPGRIIVDAPIDELELVIRESFPPQYSARIVSGLPSGCAQFESATITNRSGNEITIRVTNTMPDDPNVACTAIYGTKETFIDLGSEFTSGQAYTVRVNDKTLEFVAQ
jgi:hypothetical protein